MKDFIRKKLLESLNLPKDIDKGEINTDIVKGLTWNDIDINEKGDDGNTTLYMGVDFKNSNLHNISEGIDFSIQLLHDTYYQPHLFLAPSIQGLGLGPKIYKAFIMEFGHIYAGKGRTHNADANKMRSKLENDPDLEYYSDDLGTLIIKKGNPDANILLRIID